MKDKEERIGGGGVSRLHSQRKSDTNGGEQDGREEIEGEESSCTTILRKVPPGGWGVLNPSNLLEKSCIRKGGGKNGPELLFLLCLIMGRKLSTGKGL